MRADVVINNRAILWKRSTLALARKQTVSATSRQQRGGSPWGYLSDAFNKPQISSEIYVVLRLTSSPGRRTLLFGRVQVRGRFGAEGGRDWDWADLHRSLVKPPDQTSDWPWHHRMNLHVSHSVAQNKGANLHGSFDDKTQPGSILAVITWEFSAFTQNVAPLPFYELCALIA